MAVRVEVMLPQTKALLLGERPGTDPSLVVPPLKDLSFRESMALWTV